MAWIKSYQALEKHPKLLKFMKTLNVNQNEAIGIIHKFWWWCLDYAETGNLLDVDPEILGNTLGVPKDMIGKVLQGDCLDVLRDIPDKSIDLILTDPP